MCYFANFSFIIEQEEQQRCDIFRQQWVKTALEWNDSKIRKNIGNPEYEEAGF